MENVKENKVEQVIESALKKIKEYGANQVVGTPIVNDKGHTVIPMSNVTVAVFSGGGEYGDVKVEKGIGEKFAGGAVTVCSIKPETFIVNNGLGFSLAKSNSDLVEGITLAFVKLGELLKK